jgi:hypothetical protein
VSGNQRRKLDGLLKTADSATGYLIGQLGRNTFHKTSITGNQIIDFAMNVIAEAHILVGGRFVLVEYEDSPILKELYTRNNFIYLQKDEENDLIQLFRII